MLYIYIILQNTKYLKLKKHYIINKLLIKELYNYIIIIIELQNF